PEPLDPSSPAPGPPPVPAPGTRHPRDVLGSGHGARRRTGLGSAGGDRPDLRAGRAAPLPLRRGGHLAVRSLRRTAGGTAPSGREQLRRPAGAHRGAGPGPAPRRTAPAGQNRPQPTTADARAR